MGLDQALRRDWLEELSRTPPSMIRQAEALGALAAWAVVCSGGAALVAAEGADTVVLPGARTEELTPANGWPARKDYDRWSRSLGGPTSARYSNLRQIDVGNVTRLRPAWTYHSRDGMDNIECNPILVNGLMVTPTPGQNLVAVDAATGREVWRFDPGDHGNRHEDQPARRGLLYWPGENGAAARLLFTVGDWVYAMSADTGRPLDSFGHQGRSELPMGGSACGAVYRQVFVVPGFNGDVFGYDVISGTLRWRFHTIPRPGEFGAETWEHREDGANCWGGMAMDESRGIAYVATGSPKPNFHGATHRGDNLFANCVIALDAATGRRLWHFQEIRHDIWDLDLPAPPNLVTIMHDGKRVDAVAQVTKLGNTLLLDRVTGKLLFPFRLRRAPPGLLPGEVTASYQPDVELPEPFAREFAFPASEITNRTPAAHAFIERRIAGGHTGWFETFELGKPTTYYGTDGGAEWTGAAFDPGTGRLYVTANQTPWMERLMIDDDPPRADPPTPGQVPPAPGNGHSPAGNLHGSGACSMVARFLRAST